MNSNLKPMRIEYKKNDNVFIRIFNQKMNVYEEKN